MSKGNNPNDTKEPVSAKLEAATFREVFIVPDTGEVYAFKVDKFPQDTYKDFEDLLEKQSELNKANIKLREASEKLDKEVREKKKSIADTYKSQSKELDMDKELSTLEITTADEYNQAIKDSEKAFKSCDDALAKAVGGGFKSLRENENSFVEVISLSRGRPILLSKSKFDELTANYDHKGKLEEPEEVKPCGAPAFMALTKLVEKEEADELMRKKIISSFKDVNGQVKLDHWSKGEQGTLPLGNSANKALKKFNESAKISANKDKELFDTIKTRLRQTEFGVDDAEFVLRNLRDLYGKKNEESKETEGSKFIDEKLGTIDDMYTSTEKKEKETNEDSITTDDTATKEPKSTIKYTVPSLTDEDKGKATRNELQEDMDSKGLPPKLWDASASAKVLRYSAAAGASAAMNLKEGKIDYSVTAEAKFDIIDAKAETNCWLPSDKGAHFYFKAGVRKSIVQYSEPPQNAEDNTNEIATFFLNSSFITAPAARALLINLKEAENIITANNSIGATFAGLSDNEKAYVSLRAHTDKIASDKYNLRLSWLRVLSTFAFIYKDVNAWDKFSLKKLWGANEYLYMRYVLGEDFDFSPYQIRRAEQKASFLKEEHFGENLIKELEPQVAPASTTSVQEYYDRINGIAYINGLQWEEETVIESTEGVDSEEYNKIFKIPTIGKLDEYVKDLKFTYDVDFPVVVDAYMDYLHDTVIRQEKLTSLNLDKLLIVRGNISGVGEKETPKNTSEINYKDRKVDVLCHLISGVKQSTENSTIDFGHIRLALNGYVSAWAGVYASVTAGVQVESDKLMLLKGLQPQEFTEEQEREIENKDVIGAKGSKEKGTKVDEGASASLVGDAFAGAKAEAGVKMVLDWKKPEDEKFAQLAEAGYSVVGSAGAGATVDFRIGYDVKSGKFVCYMKAEATLGIGCGGSVSFAVSANAIIDFIKLVYEKLSEVDFSFLDVFETEKEGARLDVYKMFSQTVLELIKKGHFVGALSTASVGIVAAEAGTVLAKGQELVLQWKYSSQERDGLEKLAETIGYGPDINNDNVDDDNLEHSEIMNYLTPEVKGRILYLLTKYKLDFFGDIMTLDWNGANEKLALKIFKHGIKSKNDYQQTLKHYINGTTKVREKLTHQVSNPKSIDEEPTSEDEAKKHAKMLKNQEWLKSAMFSDNESGALFDRLIAKFQ